MPFNIFRAALLTLFILLPHLSFADNSSLNESLKLLPKGTDASILVKTVEDKPKTLIANKNNEFKVPASVLKIVTALAAELELGSDFRFTTSMMTNGKITDKKLSGDLVIKMSGDPTFSRTQLSSMVAAIKKQGITQITGNVVIDTSVFNGHDKAPGWSWDNLTACYNTKPSATIIDGNCFYTGIIPSKKVGEQITTSLSPLYPVKITTDAVTIASESAKLNDKFCDFEVDYQSHNHYHLTGCVKQSGKYYVKFAVQDDIDYFSSILSSELSKQGIKLKGKITSTKTPKKASTLLASSQSEPLNQLLTSMLKNSDNLIADTLFRTIGAKYYGMAGNWKNSSDAVKNILQNKAGINLHNAVIVDGSGLSRLNLIDADKLMDVLQYIAANNQTLHMIDMLPIGGVDGTLQYRKSFTDKTLKSIVYAKTGFLEGNHNLAGFIKTEKGGYLAFIQLISGYSSEQKPKNKPLIDFEKSFYESIIKTDK